MEDEFWRKIPAFAKVSQAEFLDYKWQIKHSVSDEIALISIIKNIAPQEFITDISRGFSFAPMTVKITPYLLSLINWNHPENDPICKQFIPVSNCQREDHPMLTFDSLHEIKDTKVSGLIHRYPDKALFLPLNTCPVYCRFCTRSYTVGGSTKTLKKVNLNFYPQHWEKVFNYIESHPELEDIVISGGDTYNLSAEYIQKIGFRLLEIPNIRRIRFATRGIAVMPMKILTDLNWLDALNSVHTLARKLHKEVALHTHFNSSQEITAISRPGYEQII